MNNKHIEFGEFCELCGPQLLLSGIPQHFWKRLAEKLEGQIFDAGDCFTLMEVESEENGGDGDKEEDCAIAAFKKWKVLVTSDNGISTQDANNIFLVDHSWTYRLNDARTYLQSVGGLLERMCSMMGVQFEEANREACIGSVLDIMWLIIKLSSTMLSYVNVKLLRSMFPRRDLIKPDSARSAEDRLPVWYIVDEFGCRIQHSDDPTFRLIPFYYPSQSIFYSLLFPIKDCDKDDEVTRDLAEGPQKQTWKSIYLSPWNSELLTCCDEVPPDFPRVTDEFFTSHREGETLPENLDAVSVLSKPRGKLKVYADYSAVNDSLTDSAFQIVSSNEQADVWWLFNHYKDFKELASLHPETFINQFPHESLLTVKDLFAAVVHSAYQNDSFDPETFEKPPSWFALTYNLQTELPNFVSHFKQRALKGLDNHWIIKPWNLARGMDTLVTNNLPTIIRITDSGPKNGYMFKIACKYVDNPVLFPRPDAGMVKFDIRFIVFLISVKPFKAVVYDRFWLRFATKPFSLDNLDDYGTHFTVMNYADDQQILQMFCEEFVEKFEQEYPDVAFKEVLTSCHEALKEGLEAACREDAPRGLAHFPNSRAMYGADVMLRWTTDSNGRKSMQPTLLEWNFAPDCTRACVYYPDFMNTVFRTLFTEDLTGQPVTVLTD